MAPCGVSVQGSNGVGAEGGLGSCPSGHEPTPPLLPHTWRRAALESDSLPLPGLGSVSCLPALSSEPAYYLSLLPLFLTSPFGLACTPCFYVPGIQPAEPAGESMLQCLMNSEPHPRTQHTEVTLSLQMTLWLQPGSLPFHTCILLPSFLCLFSPPFRFSALLLLFPSQPAAFPQIIFQC